jgi:hypothetical protein
VTVRVGVVFQIVEFIRLRWMARALLIRRVAFIHLESVMLRTKHAVLAAAVIAAWSAASVSAQTTATGGVSGPVAIQGGANDNPEERASAVIRIIDAPGPSTQAVPVNTVELVRARAAGDMEAGERGEPIQIERIRIDDPVKSSAKPGAPAAARRSEAQVQARSDVQPQIVRAEGEPKGRTETRAIVRLDDAARYRETAKYEADRKRRDSESAAAASQPAGPRTTEPKVTVMGTAQGRAEISWSAPEPEAPPVVVVESPQEILRN